MELRPSLGVYGWQEGTFILRLPLTTIELTPELTQLSSLPNSQPQPPPPLGSDPVSQLVHYETSIAGLRAGLVDLESTPSYLMLSGSGLAGATKQKLGNAALQAEALWPLLLAIGQRLDEARSLVEANTGFLNRSTKDLGELLAQPLGPIAAAGFEGRTTTLATAVNEVRTRYSAVREGASEVEALWLSVLPRVDSARATLNDLAKDANELGIVEPLIGRATALAEDLSSRLVTDPLSVHPKDGQNLDSRVDEAVRQIARLQAGREDLAEDLVEAKQLLSHMRSLRSQAGANRAESETKVLNPVGLVQIPSEVIFDHPENGLGSQLRRVTASSDWTSQRTLLDLWLTSARRLDEQLKDAESKNAAPLDERKSLRGRLSAYQAKMAAVGMAEDMELTGLVDAATDELFTVPTDLTRASTLIAELAERLRTGG